MRWKGADLSVPNVAARKPKDCLMVLDSAAETAVVVPHKNITVHLPEVPAISVLCKRKIRKYSGESLIIRLIYKAFFNS